jgi:hypothetical protein
MNAECPLCGNPVDFAAPEEEFRCRICGRYEMSFELRVDRDIRAVGDEVLKVALSAATRQENFFKRRTLKLTLKNYLSYAETHRWTPVSRKFTMALEVGRKQSAHFGASFKLDHKQDYPLFDAVSPEEAWAIIAHLEGNGLISPERVSDEVTYALTAKGWELLEPFQSGGIPGRCFIAMAFDPDLDDAYYQGIKPAILDCGYQPICLKEIATNDNICDLILSELRKAQFVVADFTKQKGGVYFESGFGKALGKEVFWTCRDDDFHRLHFDTNHYGHIKWTEPADLRDQLRNRILAELGHGPH